MTASTEDKVRILLLDSGGGYGGPGAFLCYLLRSMDRERFEPHAAFYFAHTAPEIEELRRLNVPVHFLSRSRRLFNLIQSPARFPGARSRWGALIQAGIRQLLLLVLVDLWQAARLLLLLRSLRIELVVLNNDVQFHRVGAMVAKLSGVPCICRKAGGVGTGRRIKKLLTPCVDLFIAVSEATARDQRENNPASKRIVTVYEGISVDRFAGGSSRPQIRAELDIPPGCRLVGYVARLVEGKGHPEFIEAAARVRARHPNVHFLIVGDDMAGATSQYASRLRDTVERLGLSDCVTFAGWRTDIPQILAALDLFVHCPTTWIEGLGLAHLEAMAAGKPTVVSQNGGLTDAAVDGVTGFIVPPGDIHQLAAAMLWLLEDSQFAAQCGRNARRRVEDLFDARKNTRELERYFLEYALWHRRAAHSRLIRPRPGGSRASQRTI